MSHQSSYVVAFRTHPARAYAGGAWAQTVCGGFLRVEFLGEKTIRYFFFVSKRLALLQNLWEPKKPTKNTKHSMSNPPSPLSPVWL